MKKTSLIVVAALCVVCHLSAAEFNWKQLGDLYRAGDYANLETAALAMKGDANSDVRKGKIIESAALARLKLGRYPNTAAALADIDALAGDLGIAVTHDLVQAAKLQLLYTRREHAAAVELSASWAGARTLQRRGIALSALKRYAEASAAFAASGAPGSLVSAAKAALQAKLPEKVYEYSLAAFANGDVKDAATGIQLVNAVLDADYTGTSVTSAKVKELLQIVNRKYSRKLVVNAPSKWDELIQLVRQTLETY